MKEFFIHGLFGTLVGLFTFKPSLIILSMTFGILTDVDHALWLTGMSTIARTNHAIPISIIISIIIGLIFRKKKKIKVEGFEGPFTAPGSGSIAKPRKAKASDTNKSIEQQVADARQEGLAFQENEWDSMWKNAAKSKPKMSFKQASAFVDEVGLDKKEKTNALKTAKKWLK